MAKYRAGRINEEVKKEVSRIIQYEVKDPRMTCMVSVTKVDVTKDLKYAKIFVSVFGKEEGKEESFNALKRSAGFIRREVGRNLKLRCTPELIFTLDDTIEHGMHINEILRDIKEKSNE
ncbi:MAG: 30S ribosome-binding factor RbfA [Clostridiaceae bacterium]